MNSKVKGKVIECKGEPAHHSFVILGEDGKEYHAHLCDTVEYEKIVIDEQQKRHKNGKANLLSKGDEVEFQPFDNARLRAIHIKPI